MEDSGAPELAWLDRVRSQPAYWTQGNVPADILFNMDDAATFAEQYSLAWGYRTSRGPSAGAATAWGAARPATAAATMAPTGTHTMTAATEATTEEVCTATKKNGFVA